MLLPKYGQTVIPLHPRNHLKWEGVLLLSASWDSHLHATSHWQGAIRVTELTMSLLCSLLTESIHLLPARVSTI